MHQLGSKFRLYFAGQALSTFGDSLIPLTIAFAALHLEGPGLLGLTLAANRVPIAALVLFGGALGDRWNRRWVMLGADLLRCGTQLTTGLLLVFGAAQAWHLVLLQGLAGVGTAAFVPAASGLVPALVRHEQLQRANALLGLATNANKVLAISVAGAVVATAGPGISLLVDSATFAASAVSLFLLRLPEQARDANRSSLWRELREGACMVASTPWLRSLISYNALLQGLVIGPHMVAGPLLAEAHLGGAGAWATIGVVQAVGSIAGGLCAMHWQPKRPLLTAYAVGFLMVPYLLLLAMNAPLWLVAAFAIAVGAQGALFMTIQSTLLQRHVPATSRSRVAAWSQLGNLVFLPTSLAVAGPVAAASGGGPILLVGTGWLALSTIFVLCKVPATGITTKSDSPAVAEESPTS
ncbi:MFS transporter [Saccharopolyspora griseoalba]|uniref:MFS transporter n=1 Tax=Saccharopolyspora griseoalba TaxID=1431848 RepID=A0ABW2LHQ4_9PSEU